MNQMCRKWGRRLFPSYCDGVGWMGVLLPLSLPLSPSFCSLYPTHYYRTCPGPMTKYLLALEERQLEYPKRGRVTTRIDACSPAALRPIRPRRAMSGPLHVQLTHNARSGHTYRLPPGLWSELRGGAVLPREWPDRGEVFPFGKEKCSRLPEVPVVINLYMSTYHPIQRKTNIQFFSIIVN